MASAIVVFDKRDKSLLATLAQQVQEMPEGYAFVTLHPKMLKLFQRIHSTSAGELTIHIKDGIPLTIVNHRESENL